MPSKSCAVFSPTPIIGVTVSNLKKDAEIVEQQDLFADQAAIEKQEELNKVLDKINGKYSTISASFFRLDTVTPNKRIAIPSL